jgi:hypothetical protein
MKNRFTPLNPIFTVNVYRDDDCAPLPANLAHLGCISRNLKTITIHFKNTRMDRHAPHGYSTEEAFKLAQEIIRGDCQSLDFIVVEDLCMGEMRLRAIPVYAIAKKLWTMFDGRFAWTSDSRFFGNPIKIHDRTE